MKQKNKMILAATVLLLAANAWAANAETELLDAFARCDSKMFGVLKNRQAQLSAYTPVEKVGGTARFKLSGSEEEQSVKFKKPMEINGMKLVGFYSTASELPFNESGNNPFFYYWGFKIEGETAASVAAKLPQLGLKEMGSGFMANPQIITDTAKSLKWQPNALATGGSLPAKNTVEKVLYLEQNGSQVQLGCSIQGYIPQALLQHERPDLGK